MKTLFITTLCVFIVTSVQAVDLPGICTIKFFATSTLHDFEGSATSKEFVATLEDDDERRSSATVIIPIDRLDTNSKFINRDMRRMFRDAEHPNIIATITNISPYVLLREAQSPETKGSFKIRLQIQDVEREVAVSFSNLQEDQNHISATFDFTISLADFKLEPSSLLWLVRVGDKVKIRATLTLSKPNEESYFGEFLTPSPSDANPKDDN